MANDKASHSDRVGWVDDLDEIRQLQKLLDDLVKYANVDLGSHWM
jgi:hypothetical protein